MALSAVLITKNEERNVERCLSSLMFCDEIIVVDSFSTDKTIEIAKKYTEKVYQHSWEGYAAQKNFAISLSKNNWILSIDADEEVPAELQKELIELFQKEPDNSAYLIGRRTIHSGKWIKHGGWYPNRLVRLFDKRQGTWQGGAVHEFWSTKGPVSQMHNDLLHYSFLNISDQVERNNRYSTLGAQVLHDQDAEFSVFKLVTKPIFKFIETYFLKRGFFDGYLGFIISVSAAYSVFLKWAKLWELLRDEKKN